MNTKQKQPIEDRLSYKLRLKNGKFNVKAFTADEVRQRILDYCPEFKHKYDIIQDYLQLGFTETHNKYANELTEEQLNDLVQIYKRQEFDGLFDINVAEQKELKSLWQMPLAELTAADLEVILLLNVKELELLKKYRSQHLTTPK